MINFNYDENKAIAGILYIAEQLHDDTDERSKPDFHKIFKIFYFADQKHLIRYARPIVGDYYIAMAHGPVPSHIYDILKNVNELFFTDDDDCNTVLMKSKFSKYFEVKSHFVYPIEKPDLDELSESDIECLNESIKENKYLDFQELKDISHDNAYNKAGKNDQISFKEMLKVAGADSDDIEYIKLISENGKTFNYDSENRQFTAE